MIGKGQKGQIKGQGLGKSSFDNLFMSLWSLSADYAQISIASSFKVIKFKKATLIDREALFHMGLIFALKNLSHMLKFYLYINLILATFWDMGYITMHEDNILWKYHQNWTREIWKIQIFVFFYLIKVYKSKFLTYFRHSPPVGT